MGSEDKKRFSPLENYLDWYQKQENPGFAVLIKGPWGVGKTFQVKAFFDERKSRVDEKPKGKIFQFKKISSKGEDDEADHYYVSVYGLETVDQIHAAVLAEVAPVKWLGEFAKVLDESLKKGVSKTTQVQLPDGIISGLVRKNIESVLKKSKTIIFDDIERSNISLKNLTGAINKYIEHYKCRVIVISHDEKLQKKFSKIKEKIIGHEIKAESQIEEALKAFLGELSPKYKDQIAEYEDTIIGVFEKSKAESLRILSHAVQDLERFYEKLEPAFSSYNTKEKNVFGETIDPFGLGPKKLYNPNEFSNKIIELFLIFNIEVRNGKLTREILEKRLWILVSSENGELKKALKDAQNRHGIDLATPIFSDEFLVQIFIDGVYDTQEISNLVKHNNLDNLPAWLKVFTYMQYPDEIVEEALKEMNKQFNERIVTVPGEMLHIFALRLFLVEEKIIDGTLEEEEELCLNYIQYLQDQGRHVYSFPLNEMGIRDLRQSSHGYGYFVSKEMEPHFDRIFDALIEIYQENLINSFTKDEFVTELLSNPKEILAKYNRKKFLSKIDTNFFVKKWLELSKNKRIIVSDCLEEHFDHLNLTQNQNESEYKNEFDWMEKVFSILKEKVAEKKANKEFLSALAMSHLIFNLPKSKKPKE